MQIGSSNFSWHGAAVDKRGRIVAVPYNSPWVLEVGDDLCGLPIGDHDRQADGASMRRPALQPTQPLLAEPSSFASASLFSSITPANLLPALSGGAVPSTAAAGSDKTGKDTYVLAMLGCPEAAKASEDACFHVSHRTWHSAMITIMPHGARVLDIREQVAQVSKCRAAS